MEYKKINKILIFKLCCFGDIVFILPVIENLREKFPEAKITIISSDWVKSLLPYINYIDNSIIYNPPERDNNLLKKIVSAVKLIFILRKEKFDMVFLGHRNNFFGLILILSGIRYRLGFNVTKFMNVTSEFDESVHENLRYLKILEENDINFRTKLPKLEKVYPSEKIKSANDIPDNKLIIGIFPFGGVNPGTVMTIKRWDFNKYVELVKKLSFSEKIYIIIFEGKDESEKINETDKNLFKGASIRKINPDLISICDLFIGGDTGPLHIAAAFGNKTLGIFGPSSPLLVAPLNPEYDDFSAKNNEYIWKAVICSPCYTPETSIDADNEKYWSGKVFKCYTGTHECLKSVEVNEVYDKIKSMINL